MKSQLQFDDSPSATDASGKSMDKGSGNENDDQIVDERTETVMESVPSMTTTRSGSQSPSPQSDDTATETALASSRLGKQHAISESTVVTAAATACS